MMELMRISEKKEVKSFKDKMQSMNQNGGSEVYLQGQKGMERYYSWCFSTIFTSGEYCLSPK